MEQLQAAVTKIVGSLQVRTANMDKLSINTALWSSVKDLSFKRLRKEHDTSPSGFNVICDKYSRSSEFIDCGTDE